MSNGVDTLHHEQRIYRTTELVVISLNMVLWLVMLGIGFWGLFDRFLTVGDFAATVYILQRLSAGSFTFLQMGQQIFRALGTIKDAMPVMTTPPTITDRPDATELTVSRGGIRFENVRFAYKSGKPVIDDLSLTVRPGEKVGLVGLSGAGKTTLVSLLLRFYDIEDGAILIDGQDIRAVTQQSLRQSIGIVPQDTVLFNDTVEYNIAYGRTGADRQAVEGAAKAAHIHHFIVSTPKGYDTMVGERGLKLSGGEKQRVAIARTLLKNPPLLIFDEATSALDSANERAIQEELKSAARNKTALVIAHRLSTVVDAHQILVMELGRILERGTHAELLALNGRYAEMWRLQQSRADEEALA
jgi:ATP-binding cassette subfamily B protein/ATP-binding cassette subfamily B multidrug efflux pump